MRRLAIYGILMGLALAGWNLLEYTLGYKGYPVGRFSWFVSIFLLLLGLLLGIKAYREKEKGGVLSYWEVVIAGAVMVFLAGLVQGSFMYAYHVYINPDFVSYVQQKRRQEFTAHGATPAQLAEIARQISTVYQPLRLAANTLGGSVVVGMIFSLIMGTFLKRYPPQ